MKKAIVALARPDSVHRQNNELACITISQASVIAPQMIAVP